MNKKYIPLLIAILFLVNLTGNISGQRKQQQKTVTITSTIRDDSGNPVPNAIITAKEGAYEVLSDAEGRFTIDAPENTEILIEAKGFDMLSVPIAIASQGITLNKVPFLMDEANEVYVPFGKLKRKEVTGAFSTINPQEIAKYDNSQYVFDAINGRIPGLYGNTNIRTLGTALLIVDGLPRDISNVNLEEIEQITVLKDANASVLYGTQAKNGVILVTTKRGQANKRVINVSAEQGFSTPVAYPQYLNSDKYMELYNEAWKNDGLDPLNLPFPDSITSGSASGRNPYRFPSVDYYSSEYLRSARPITKILTEFSGGNNVTRYYANVGWIHNGAMYQLGEGQDATYNRFNVRGNVDVKVNDYINAFVDVVGIFTINNNPNGNFWGDAATYRPYYFSQLLPTRYIASDAVFAGGASLETAKLMNGDNLLGGTSSYRQNIYGNMYRSGYTQDLTRGATFNNGLDFDLRDLVQGLKFKAYLSFDIYNKYNQNVTDQYAVYEPVWNSFGSGAAVTDSIVRLTMIGTDQSTGVQNLPTSLMQYVRRLGTYGMFDYARSFGSHNLSGVFLGYYDTYRVNNVMVDVENAHLGLRLAYDFNKKYFIDFSSAYVNGFRLAEGNKGAFSPTIGLGWVISEEDFLSGSSLVNYLRLRASAGIINTEFGGSTTSGISDYYNYKRTFVTVSSWGWADGLRSTSNVYSNRSENPDLDFEKKNTLNIGFEGYFFNSALYMDANLFTTKYSGQVIQRSIYPNLIGTYNRPFENYNETTYKGGELGISWTQPIGELILTAGANMLYATSELTVRDEIWEEDYLYRQGRTADVMFGLESIGFFQSETDITSSPVQMYGEVKPGDIKYRDQNGDNIIDARDQVEIGNSMARLSYGLTLNLRYKNFNLFAIGNGRNGAENMYSGNYFWVDGTDKYSEVVLNRWTPSTASSADFPRLTTKSSTNNFQNSSFWLFEDNYFSIDRVQLTYDLPRNIAQKLFSKNLSLYLRGERVAEFMKDKEKRNIVVGGEPLYRNYALGARIDF